MILDLFAGPGGWSEGLRLLGLTDVGIELDPWACATRVEAGHATVRADVASLPVAQLRGKLRGLIASPPCQGLSAAGLREGVVDLGIVIELLGWLAAGRDRRAEYAARMADTRSLLLVEPLRYALASQPEWIALEQVPAALPVWLRCRDLLQGAGYSAWAGVLNSADYGVPQTRTRAILIASRTRRVSRPEATHYDPRKGSQLWGEPWVPMAQALGWPGGERINTRGERTTPGGNEFPSDRPSWALTEKARSWVVDVNVGGHARGYQRDMARPAPTLMGQAWKWSLRVGSRANATRREETEPAPALFFGHHMNNVSWDDGERRVRLTLEQAAILQSFRADYPWQGGRTKRFEQVGNAVPPLLAAHVVSAAVGVHLPARAVEVMAA